MSVILETSLGDIVVDLYVTERPKCCENFLKLCKIKYYNFCLFHSVQRNLVAQTGDPSGTGRGGSSVFEKLYGEQARYFDAEIKPRIKHVKRGTLSMVNNGANQHGSQFFLTLAENIDYLDGAHTVFGEVAEGFDILDQINEAYVDADKRPYKDIRIYHTVVLEDPYDDPSGLAEFIPDRSPEPTAEQLASDRIGAEEAIDNTEGKTEEEINEMLEEKEARANAQILEMVGDLPTADSEAPDNVLFVCKLNPVTSGDDLEVIFSRFGNIVSCEVIKDHKTGESLQYAFIEFEKPEDCESAYFKMDNVLIDDRRIHVDFSQSVSKLKYNNGKKDKYQGAQLRIKDKTRQDGYQLVYSDDEEQADKDSSKTEKSKRHAPQRAALSDGKSRDNARRQRASRSVSRERKPAKRRSRSRSRDDKRRQRSKSKDRKRNRSRSRERKRNRSRSHDRKRNRSKSNDRKRHRSRSHDRARHRSRSNDRKRNRSPSLERRRSRSRSRERGRHDDRRHKHRRDARSHSRERTKHRHKHDRN